MPADDIDWTGLANKQFAAGWTQPERHRFSARNDATLVRARDSAHKEFDKIWKKRHMTRTEAYRWLAREMGVPYDDCHMGMMSVSDCRKVERLSAAYLAKKRQP